MEPFCFFVPKLASQAQKKMYTLEFQFCRLFHASKGLSLKK